MTKLYLPNGTYREIVAATATDTDTNRVSDARPSNLAHLQS